MISTLYCGAASLASTVARAGVLPGDTQASHTAFISAKFAMSVIQMLAASSLVLLVPAAARKLSICDRTSGLFGRTFAFRIIGDDTGQIHGVAVDHRLA